MQKTAAQAGFQTATLAFRHANAVRWSLCEITQSLQGEGSREAPVAERLHSLSRTRVCVCVNVQK